MVSGISYIRTRVGLLLAALLMVSQLTACGDKEGEQRKAFIDFLQNTVMRSGEQLPNLSENQKQKFGPYVSQYATIHDFSQQLNNTLNKGVKPVMEALTTIHKPQDYLTQRDAIRQANSNLAILAQQLQNAKNQADSNKNALKQSDDLKTIWDNVYNKIVTRPASRLLPLLPGLQSLSQTVVQTGDYLQSQGTRVSFNNNGIQFPTQEQASQYNGLMNNLAGNTQALSKMQQALQTQ